MRRWAPTRNGCDRSNGRHLPQSAGGACVTRLNFANICHGRNPPGLLFASGAVAMVLGRHGGHLLTWTQRISPLTCHSARPTSWASCPRCSRGRRADLPRPHHAVSMPGRPRHRACATAGAATYTVASGDSWFSVATASGTTTAALLGANGADASAVLYPGDVLCLPNGVASPAPTSQGGCATKHVVVRGDSWFAISRAAACR